VASDVNAFLQHTREALPLEDGEYAVLRPDHVEVRRVADRTPVQRKPLHVDWDAETSRKGGYAHYMLKEIFEQPQTVLNALNVPHAEIERYAQLVNDAPQAYLMGVGTTHYVALTGQYFFSQLAGRLLPAVSADEFQDLAVLAPGDLLISISQSGETLDTRRAVAFAKERGARTASIVNVMGSSLSMMTDDVILQGSGPEICVVSTKAALAQMVILLRIALELGLRRGHIDEAIYRGYHADLEAFPDIVQTALNERSGAVRNLADRVVQYRNWLVLGRGIYYPISLEAALKMKEVTYLHVEGMPGGFLKHGTLALVDETMLSLFFLPPVEQKTLHEQTLSALEEVRARGGPVVGFVFENDLRARQLIPDRIELPVVPPTVAPFLQLVMAQLFAYFSALKLGRSIDKPRNLAKSVTVG
jgi:glutamine---fructose-6-phosphate transaminase (isomerizing)